LLDVERRRRISPARVPVVRRTLSPDRVPYSSDSSISDRYWYSLYLPRNKIKYKISFQDTLVLDPDPDPYVFGPLGAGSGFVIICTDPDLDPSINRQKSKINPNHDFHCFVTSRGYNGGYYL
jgi:hypothetical protein